jgi:two-component system OmpR family sensor kinase
VTLRARLVAGLVVLMTLGLAIFGVTMYELYSRSQYDQLTSELQSSVPLVTRELSRAAGVYIPVGGQGAGSGGNGAGNNAGAAPGRAEEGGPPSGGGPGGPQVLVTPGTYGELVNEAGKILSYVPQVGSSSPQPRVPAALVSKGTRAQLVHVGSLEGGTGWLAYIGPRLSNGDRVIVALPSSQVTSSLHHLIVIELAGAVGVLLVLSAGSGLVLRRGLSPLERMADTTKEIAAGDLSRRVQVSSSGSEVGQLAVAFNTMLDEIQAAFAERDATEGRLRQFLADASHELRTPLTSIQGFAELFRLGADNPGLGTGTIMRRIEEESARMKVLVEDLLLLARLDQVRQSERRPVDLSVLAADACSDATAAAPDRPITLSAPQPVVVLGDEAHLRQALANLLTNALTHTPAGSPVEVSVHLEGGRAVVEVRDHGTGLDEEAHAHVFDRFWQKDPARAGAGAGLGLAIVAAVAEEHNGSVTASNPHGGGALFTIALPLVPKAR